MSEPLDSRQIEALRQYYEASILISTATTTARLSEAIAMRNEADEALANLRSEAKGTPLRRRVQIVDDK